MEDVRQYLEGIDVIKIQEFHLFVTNFSFYFLIYTI